MKMDKPSGTALNKKTLEREMFAKNADSSYIKRKRHFDGKVKICPIMMHRLSSNGNPIPRHKLLEDDWRAFRAAIHNHFRLQGFMTPAEVVEEVNNTPQMEAYDSVVPGPGGYLYYRHRLAHRHKAPHPVGAMAHGLPVVYVEGPFGPVYHMPDELRHGCAPQAWSTCYDPDHLLLNDMDDRLLVYNLPDAVPGKMKQLDLTVPLFERTLNILGMSSNADLPPPPPVVPRPLTGFQPVTKLDVEVDETMDVVVPLILPEEPPSDSPVVKETRPARKYPPMSRKTSSRKSDHRVFVFY